MAIVNRTPDLFFDKGASWADDAAMDRVHAVIAEGADIIDIGGVKAGPGEYVSPEEEARRTVPFIAAVRRAYPDIVISVDTWRHEVGRAACEAGADVLNDAAGRSRSQAGRDLRRNRLHPHRWGRAPDQTSSSCLRRRDAGHPHPNDRTRRSSLQSWRPSRGHRDRSGPASSIGGALGSRSSGLPSSLR